MAEHLELVGETRASVETSQEDWGRYGLTTEDFVRFETEDREELEARLAVVYRAAGLLTDLLEPVDIGPWLREPQPYLARERALDLALEESDRQFLLDQVGMFVRHNR